MKHTDNLGNPIGTRYDNLGDPLPTRAELEQRDGQLKAARAAASPVYQALIAAEASPRAVADPVFARVISAERQSLFVAMRKSSADAIQATIDEAIRVCGMWSVPLDER